MSSGGQVKELQIGFSSIVQVIHMEVDFMKYFSNFVGSIYNCIPSIGIRLSLSVSVLVVSTSHFILG